MHSRISSSPAAALNHSKLLIRDMSGMPVLGVRQEAETVERGVSKTRRAQTDLIVPRTVQLTQQTPVVANHAVKKMSHGSLHW